MDEIIKKIFINSVIRKCDNDRTKIEYNISTSLGEDFTLWYEVDEKYMSALSEEISDGVIVTLLPYAVRGGYDIVSKLPISETLFFRLTSQLIPILKDGLNNAYETKIVADRVICHFNSYAVASGISCGVDSFTTLFEYTEDCEMKSYQLTHLTYFENGAHHLNVNGHCEKKRELFEKQCTRIKKFCDRYGYELIVVRSNLDDFLIDCFGPEPFQNTHTYRNAGFVLLLQKLIKTYFYSTASECGSDIRIELDDPAHYEKILLPYISTNNTEFYNSNKQMTRLEKTQYISEFNQTYDNLLVCYRNENNCGRCLKCIRTLLTLDFIGKLKEYSGSFDIDYYQKNRTWYLTRLCMGKKYNPFMKELYEYSKEKHINIPLRCKAKGSILALLRYIYIYTQRISNL